MAVIGQPFDQTVPAVGTSGTAYASTINLILQEVIDRLSTRVPVGSIAAATAALDMNNQAVQNMSYAGLYEQLVSPSGAPFGRLAHYASDLYWVGSSGAVQITVGTALNASAIGGIVGNYGGGNPAKVSFDNASETYLFYDDMSLAQWAIIKARRLDLVDETTSRVVTVIPSATIAASYTLSLPTNVPAANALLSMSAAGAVTTGTTIATAETFSGVVTFSADPVLSGTTNVRHGARTLQVALFPIDTVNLAVAAGALTTTGAAVEIIVPLTLQQGWRVTGVKVMGNKTTGGVATLRVRYKVLTAAIGTEATDTSSAVGDFADLELSGMAMTVIANTTYFLSIQLPASGDSVNQIELTYDVVA